MTGIRRQGTLVRVTSQVRVRGTDEYISFMARVTRAAGQRVGDADPAQLAELILIRKELDGAIGVAVRGLRLSGATWQEIADATGTTRQAAWEKWGKL